MNQFMGDPTLIHETQPLTFPSYLNSGKKTPKAFTHTPQKAHHEIIPMQTKGSRHQSEKEKCTKCDLDVTQDQALS